MSAEPTKIEAVLHDEERRDRRAQELRASLVAAFSKAAKQLPWKLAPDPPFGHREQPGALTPAAWTHQVVGIIRDVLAGYGLEAVPGLVAICGKHCGIRFERGEVWVDLDGIVAVLAEDSDGY